MENEVYAIFVNSKGSEQAKDPELASFLRYIDGKAAEGEFAKEIDQAVQNIKVQEGRRKEYMLLSQEIKWMKEDLLAQGKALGEKQGNEKTTRKNAMNFLKLGISPELVAQGTGLPLAEVQALAKEIK